VPCTQAELQAEHESKLAKMRTSTVRDFMEKGCAPHLTDRLAQYPECAMRLMVSIPRKATVMNIGVLLMGSMYYFVEAEYRHLQYKEHAASKAVALWNRTL
jgi:hypothetical protein